jgi:hypothetical protein
MPRSFERESNVSSTVSPEVTADANLRRPLTLLQWAGVTGVCTWSAYELAKAGQIPGLFRLGHKYYVSRDVTERLLKTGVA